MGKATKRSRFGSDICEQVRGTRESAESCIKSNFDFHFIDAEWTSNYPNASEIDDLLTHCEEHDSTLTTIFTVNARHSVAFEFLNEAMEVVAQRGNGGFCFVAGNPAYLSTDERRYNAKSLISWMAETARTRLRTAPLFVGAESQPELAMELASKFRAIPFVLLDASVQHQVTQFASTNGTGVGIYCPYLLSSGSEDERVRALGLYALRRRWVRDSMRKMGLKVADVRALIAEGQQVDKLARDILVEGLRSLALCEANDFQNQMEKLSSAGVRYAAFLPAVETVEEHDKLSSLVSSQEG